jgi:hypothetical protein
VKCHFCDLGETLLGEMSLGEMSLGETWLSETSLGETSLGETSLGCAYVGKYVVIFPSSVVISTLEGIPVARHSLFY